eukprot:scpid104783/ scgid1718/ 
MQGRSSRAGSGWTTFPFSPRSAQNARVPYLISKYSAVHPHWGCHTPLQPDHLQRQCDAPADPSEVRLNVELLGAAEASVVSCADTDGAATPMPANRYERVNTPSREHTVKAMPSHVQDPAERERLKKEYARKLAEKQRGVNEINRQLRISEEVDLCFMVDATGSMQRWIDAVMSNIEKLYKRMQKLCCMRVAF